MKATEELQKFGELAHDAIQKAFAAQPSLETRKRLEQLQKLPPACVDLISIDPPFNSNRNYEVFWGETKEKRAFEDRHNKIREDGRCPFCPPRED